MPLRNVKASEGADDVDLLFLFFFSELPPVKASLMARNVAVTVLCWSAAALCRSASSRRAASAAFFSRSRVSAVPDNPPHALVVPLHPTSCTTPTALLSLAATLGILPATIAR